MNTRISGLNVLTSFNNSIVCSLRSGSVCSVQSSFMPQSSIASHNLTQNSHLRMPPSAVPGSLANSTTSVLATDGATLGRHLAQRLVQIGVWGVFFVPGGFNLTLLDYLIAEPGLNLIGCCNELNAGYAADGYARYRGVGACVVTVTVGGLSVLNAIAGPYSENLPVICIVGGPNSNDYGANRILHHTIGFTDFSRELHCFKVLKNLFRKTCGGDGSGACP